MNNNEKRSFPNADDLMRFMESHMLGVDGAKHNLRREIFWSSEQVENAIRAYFESMPQPVVVTSTIRVPDTIGTMIEPHFVTRIGKDVWQGLGAKALSMKNVIYSETNRDIDSGDLRVRSYLRILPWPEER